MTCPEVSRRFAAENLRVYLHVRLCSGKRTASTKEMFSYSMDAARPAPTTHPGVGTLTALTTVLVLGPSRASLTGNTS
jgi:hypothetical protein